MSEHSEENTNSASSETSSNSTGVDAVVSLNRVNRITYPQDIRFNLPSSPSYSILGSIFSIITLVFMSIFSTAILVQLTAIKPFWLVDIQLFIAAQLLPAILGSTTPFTNSDYPAWAWVPFAFTVFGSTLGALFETYLLLIGKPFQFYGTALRRFIARVRVANVAPVLFSLLFYISQIAIEAEGVRFAILLVVIAMIAALVFNIIFAPAPIKPPPPVAVPLILMATQIFGIGAVIFNVITPQEAALALIVGSVLMLLALIVNTATPIKSAGFHTLATIATIQAYYALFLKETASAGFTESVAFTLSPWWAVLTVLAGLALAIKAFPSAWGGFRSILSNIVWTLIYYNLVSAPRVANPKSLESIYSKMKQAKPDPTPLFPYSEAHPDHLLANLAIPAVPSDKLSKIITIGLKALYDKAISGFKLIQALDHNIPQANVDISLREQPRLAIWSNGSNYWSHFFRLKIFGKSMPNGGKIQKTPQPAIDTFKEGQLLAYLAESGVASCFVKPAPELGSKHLVMDFRFLEKYQTKADYLPYGGMAYFKVNSDTERLELVSVVAPKSDVVIPCDPHCPAFRAAESQVIASMYYQVVSGKHLAEIHMTLNLVEVSMENAFDAEGEWNHPFRTFMYLHFFAHQLAEELTTEHLVEEGAVFSQIFATTHDAMVEHLNDTYSAFIYGEDEEFEQRAAAMTMDNGELLPKSAIKWELQYFEIWDKYASSLINIIYASDEAVQADIYLQKFHSGLIQVLVNGLPERYDNFQTRKGVARFAADTIHHTVVRHQVYGTTGIKAATDPRISKLQIPKDDYTPGVDEWRSFAGVANATAYARFTLLTGETGQDFKNLLEAVADKYKSDMSSAFDELQQDLQTLNEEWTKTGVDRAFNYDYFRAIPEDLHTGPGY